MLQAPHSSRTPDMNGRGASRCQRAAARRPAAEAYEKRLKHAEQKLHGAFQKIEKNMDSQDYRLKAAFVTFNSEQERFNCQKASPQSECWGKGLPMAHS